MKSRKGRTSLGMVLLVVFLVTAILIGTIITVVVKGCNHVTDHIQTTAEDRDAAKAERLGLNPPLYKAGDVVFHKATDARMVVANPSLSWNGVKLGWNMKVSDGGNWDRVGGKTINETEVKRTLKTVGR